MICLLDFETQSELDLKQCGGRRYAEHESTRILCLVGSFDRQLHVWINAEWPRVFVPRPSLLEHGREFQVHIGSNIPAIFLESTTLVAHNADEFDRLVWEEKVSRKPVEWVDTIHRARAAGLPAKLDELGRKFLDVGKDDVGHRMMLKLCTLPNRYTLPGNVGLVASYCLQDVLILEHVYEKLPTLGTFNDPVLRVHRDVNSRGVRFDTDLARKIVRWGEEESLASREKIKQLDSKIVDKLRSPQVMLDWLKGHKVELPDTRKETIERFINDPDEYSEVEVPVEVFQILELRKSCLRITGAKLNQALASVSHDGRLRDSFVFHGAHTGRWSGRRVQLQNLPRGIVGLDVRSVIDGSKDYRDEAERLGVEGHQVLSTLIRPCFMGDDLLIADYNAIECRGVAWIFDEEKLLELFRNDSDPYLYAASRIFGRRISKEDKVERFIGKETTLGSGYQMSAKKFALYLANKGVKLPEGVTADLCVSSFREAYPKIVEGWRSLDIAAKLAVITGQEQWAGKCRFFTAAGNLHIQLPSGRILWYRKARIEKTLASWGKEVDQVIYESPRYGPVNLFGGKLAENIVQAICRDLLSDALVRSPVPIVLHVHDELVGEGNKDLVHELGRCMKVTPSWAEGFPVGIEYFSCPRYVKEPWDDSVRGKV